MSIDDAKRTLKGMGRTIKHNTPGPTHLAQGAKEIFWGPIGVIWVLIGLLLLFGEPIMRWLTH